MGSTCKCPEVGRRGCGKKAVHEGPEPQNVSSEEWGAGGRLQALGGWWRRPPRHAGEQCKIQVWAQTARRTERGVRRREGVWHAGTWGKVGRLFHTHLCSVGVCQAAL